MYNSIRIIVFRMPAVWQCTAKFHRRFRVIPICSTRQKQTSSVGARSDLCSVQSLNTLFAPAEKSLPTMKSSSSVARPYWVSFRMHRYDFGHQWKPMSIRRTILKKQTRSMVRSARAHRFTNYTAQSNKGFCSALSHQSLVIQEVFLQKLGSEVLRRRHTIRTAFGRKVHQIPIGPYRVHMISL